MNNLVVCMYCLDSGWMLWAQTGPNQLNTAMPFQDSQVPEKARVWEACSNCERGKKNISAYPIINQE